MKPSLLLSACALVAFLSACASAPPTHFHSLLPAPAAAGPAAPVSSRWEILPVTVPVQVDQAQWLIRMPDDTMALLENERWAAPLADEIRAALSERLRWTAPVIRQAAGWRIGVEVQRFESAPGRYARLQAEWTLRAGDGGAVRLRCRQDFEQAAGASYPALAAAHRAALARLGDALAASLLALDAGAAAGCG